MITHGFPLTDLRAGDFLLLALILVFLFHFLNLLARSMRMKAVQHFTPPWVLRWHKNHKTTKDSLSWSERSLKLSRLTSVQAWSSQSTSFGLSWPSASTCQTDVGMPWHICSCGVRLKYTNMIKRLRHTQARGLFQCRPRFWLKFCL